MKGTYEKTHMSEERSPEETKAEALRRLQAHNANAKEEAFLLFVFKSGGDGYSDMGVVGTAGAFVEELLCFAADMDPNEFLATAEELCKQIRAGRPVIRPTVNA